MRGERREGTICWYNDFDILQKVKNNIAPYNLSLLFQVLSISIHKHFLSFSSLLYWSSCIFFSLLLLLYLLCLTSHYTKIRDCFREIPMLDVPALKSCIQITILMIPQKILLWNFHFGYMKININSTDKERSYNPSLVLIQSHNLIHHSSTSNLF